MTINWQMLRSQRALAAFVLGVAFLVGCRRSSSPLDRLGMRNAPARAATPTATPMPLPGVLAIQTAVASELAVMEAAPGGGDSQGFSAASSLSPSPGELNAEGALAQRALEDGDYGTAIPLLKAIQGDPATPEYPALMLSLARAYTANSHPQDALSVLEQLVTQPMPPALLAQTVGLMGARYEDLGEWRAAIQAFEYYLELQDDAAPYVRWHIAKAYLALGNGTRAVEQLEQIDLELLPPPQRAEVLEKLASLQSLLGSPDQALVTYDSILEFAEYTDYRALVRFRRGEALRLAARYTDAAGVFAAVAREAPTTYAAYLALVALDEMEVPALTTLERAEVLCHVGLYSAALEELYHHSTTVEEDDARIHYLMGLAYEGLGEYPSALASYDTAITEYPSTAAAADARYAKAEAAVATGGDPSVVYGEFAQECPIHEQAPEALWRAARYSESLGDWPHASDFYWRLHTGYPDDSHAADAAFRHGLAYYVMGYPDSAWTLWSEALERTSDPKARARLLTWLGSAALATGDPGAAHDFWEQAADTSPWSYYGLRGSDLAGGVSMRVTGPGSEHLQGRLSDEDWEELERWVMGWSQSAAQDATDLLAHPQTGCNAALWQLGWRDEAIASYRDLRGKIEDSPGALLALTKAASELEADWVTIPIAEQLLALAAQADQDPPQALLRLAYPTTFGHLIVPDAQARGVDPLLFLALVRQESRFDPNAVSYAGATGLTQVMPATGEWIALQLGEQAFDVGLLRRPSVSVRYGVYYLANALSLYGGDWIAALVAYNAGPGNLEQWSGGQAITDYDLFYEMLPVAESQDYVRLIYEGYRRYLAIYLAGN